MKMSDWFVVLSQKQDSQTGFWRTPCDQVHCTVSKQDSQTGFWRTPCDVDKNDPR